MNSANERRTRRLANLVENAREAFQEHEVVGLGIRHWRIAKRDEDGRLNWCYSASVFSGHHGDLYVNGDISACVFGHYGDSPDPKRRLRWIGECDDIGYYVAQKAQIGMGDNGALVFDYDGDIAAQELREHWDSIKGDVVDDVWEHFEHAIELAKQYTQSSDVILCYLHNNVDYDHMEGLHNIGRVLSVRVIYAHAAIRRLCELLEEKK